MRHASGDDTDDDDNVVEDLNTYRVKRAQEEQHRHLMAQRIQHDSVGLDIMTEDDLAPKKTTRCCCTVSSELNKCDTICCTGAIGGLFFLTACLLMIFLLGFRRHVPGEFIDRGWTHPIILFSLTIPHEQQSSLTQQQQVWMDLEQRRVRIDFPGTNYESHHAWLFDMAAGIQYRLDVFSDGGHQCTTEPVDVPTHALQNETAMNWWLHSFHDLTVVLPENSTTFVEQIMWPSGVWMWRNPETEKPLRLGLGNISYVLEKYEGFSDRNAVEVQRMIADLWTNPLSSCTVGTKRVQSDDLWLRLSIASHCPPTSIAPVSEFVFGNIPRWQSCSYPFGNISATETIESAETTVPEAIGLDQVCQIVGRDRHRRRVGSSLSLGSCWVHQQVLQSLITSTPLLNQTTTIPLCDGLHDDCQDMLQTLQLYFTCMPCDVLVNHPLLVPDWTLDAFFPMPVGEHRWNMYAATDMWNVATVAGLDTLSDESNAFF